MLVYITSSPWARNEVRAWTSRRVENAVEAAGSIHSDLAKGSSVAECFTVAELRELGSE
jgi:ribosome-binding ATPase YchF (GTP1/OBG family)